jgi:putative ABC transport system substrate-binding protein
MKRREFIALLGGAAAAWPLAARTQQPAMPVIGLLNGVSFESYADRVAAIRYGLKEAGFVEGQNILIEYRSANGRYDLLPELAAELVRKQVVAIVAIATSWPAIAAKAATATIPIIFAFGGDAVDVGLVRSFNRPEANVTGVSLGNTELGPKRVELLRELVSNAGSIGFLLNPTNPVFDAESTDITTAARTVGLQSIILKASIEPDIDAALAAAAHQRVSAIVISNDAFFNSQRDQIIALAARYRLPAIYGVREAVFAGGLLSYAPNVLEMYRQTGIYTGRILKGARPGDLPIMRPTKFELIINLKTAAALGLTIPAQLLARADEVIE